MYRERLKRIEAVKKAGSVICIIGLTASMTGCFKLLKKTKSTENRDALLASLAEGNLVEEWTGEIPEGKEVQYVLVKEQTVSSADHLREYIYKYDDEGREIYYSEYTKSYYILYLCAYDDNGNIVVRKQTHEGNVTSAGFPDMQYDYKYNENGQLVYYKYTSLYSDNVQEYNLEYDEDGHLISSVASNGYTLEFDANYETIPYYETVAVLSDEIDEPEPEYVTRYYNDGGYLIYEQHDNYKLIFEYDNGEVVGTTREYVGDSKLMFNAAGNPIYQTVGKGDNQTIYEYEYNDNDDLILDTSTKGDELTHKYAYSYVYDKNGNITSMTCEKWLSDDKGGGTTTVTTTTYTYDEHGLLISEEEKLDDGTFQNLIVYSYKAILVPAS